jgi:hypothetical protein
VETIPRSGSACRGMRCIPHGRKSGGKDDLARGIEGGHVR